jgi:hypothetical protein
MEKIEVDLEKVYKVYVDVFNSVRKNNLNPFEVTMLLEIIRITNDGIIDEMKNDIIEDMMSNDEMQYGG